MGVRHPNPRLVKVHRNYSVEEVARLFTGWLGVGAESMLALLAMSWVLVGVITLIAWL
jgi:hypothetical protein